jgi:hypothetical protein
MDNLRIHDSEKSTRHQKKSKKYQKKLAIMIIKHFYRQLLGIILKVLEINLKEKLKGGIA